MVNTEKIMNSQALTSIFGVVPNFGQLHQKIFNSCFPLDRYGHIE
jgi:hypothetical protein